VRRVQSIGKHYADPESGSPGSDDGVSPWPGPADNGTAPVLERRTRRLAPPVVCVGIYLILAAFVYGAHSPLTATVLPTCGCDDISSQTWFVAWPAYALASGHNPFYSSYVAYPGGVNLMTNTGAPLLGIVFAPITWLLGPIASFNLIMRLAFALSAISMCFVLRRWTQWWPAAFIGGLLYAFSPYMIGQGQAHDFLTFAPLPPIALALLDDLVIRRQRPVRNGILLAVVTTAQLLISPEVLEMTGLLAVFALVVLAVRHPVAARQRARRVVGGLAVAAATAVVLAGYPLWMYFGGPYHVSGPPHPVADLAAYSSSVLSLVYPTALQRLTFGHWLVTGTDLLRGQIGEDTTYLGIPLLVLLGIIVVRFRRVGQVQIFALVALAAWSITLGAVLHIGETARTSIKLPYDLLERVPILDSALDLRFSLIMYLAVSVVVAIGLDRFDREGIFRSRPSRKHQTVRGAACLVVAAVALVPLAPARPYTSTAVDIPALFTAKNSPIADGDVVLSFPLPVSYIGPDDQALLWQAAADMRFKLIGFRGAVPGPGGGPRVDASLLIPPLQAEQLLSWALYGAPARPPADCATYAAIRTFLARYDVGAVTVVPSAGTQWQTVLAYFTTSLHTAPTNFEGSYVWAHVQSELARSAGC
jgi:hypothetical protein